jgi:threonine/homoserine/homoserine lactone efflux protein
MKIIISGVFLGLTLAFSFGPGFWALLQISIKKGFKKGLLFLIGFFLSDFLFMIIALLSIKSIMNGLTKSYIFGLISSIIMVCFGLFSLYKTKETSITFKSKDLPLHVKKIGLIFKGFVFNTSNPFNLVFWIGIISLSGSAYGLKTLDFYVFIICVFATSALLDIFKCYFASLLQNIINVYFLNIISKITGIIMIGSGFFIFWKICL